MIDPLYSDVEGGVNLFIYARTISETTAGFEPPNFNSLIFQKTTEDVDEINMTEEIFNDLVDNNLFNEVVIEEIIDGKIYDSYA